MFIDTQEGHIVNLSHVVSAKLLEWRTKTRMQFNMADGSEIVGTVRTGFMSANSFDLLMSPVVKADPGYSVVTYAENRECKGLIDIYEVIAWRVVPGHNSPLPIAHGIDVENLEYDCQWGVRSPSGKVRDQYDGGFPSIEAWHRHVAEVTAERRKRPQAV